MVNIHACLVHERPECVSDLVANLRFLDPESLVLLYDGSPGRQILATGIGAGLDGVIVHPDPQPMRWGRLHGFALDALRLALTLPDFTSLTVVDSDQLATRPGYSAFLEPKLSAGLGCLVSPDGGHQPRFTRSAVARAAWEERALWRPLLDQFAGADEIFPQWTFWPATVITRAAAEDIVRLAALPSVCDIMRRTRLWATEEILLPSLTALAGHRVEVNPSSLDYVRYRIRYTQRDAHRALQRPDVFWIHPVARNDKDPNRRYVRERYAGYTGGGVATSSDASADLVLTLPLLQRMASVPGDLTREEGDLLLTAARHAEHRVRVTGRSCDRTRFLLDAVLAANPGEPGADDEAASMVVIGGIDGFAAALRAFTAAQESLADGGLVAWRRGRRADLIDALVGLGVLSWFGEVGSLAVLRQVRRLALPVLDDDLDRSERTEGWLSRDEAALLALAVIGTGSLSAGAVVEVGSYCGRATVVLAAMAKRVRRGVVAIDRFDGVVGEAGALHRGEPTLERFRAAIAEAGLADVVETVQSTTGALDWQSRPIALLVVDGLHDYPSVSADFAAFAGDVVEGGLVAFHDCADYFPGVQALVRELEATPGWRLLVTVGTLALFQRVAQRTTPVAVGPRRAASTADSPSAQPLISCIMPTYNRPAFVEMAIRYFLRQDYPRKELVIVDDGEESVAHLVPGDERIRYLRVPGRGSIGGKRNTACEVAGGEIIAHWDDDDWYAPNRLSRQAEALLTGDDEVIGANRILYWAPGTRQVWRYAYPAAARPWLHDPTLCYRKTLWKAQPFPAANHALDSGWLWSGRRKRLRPLHTDALYVGILHPANTSRKNTHDGRWAPASMEHLRGVVGADLDHYLAGVS